MEWLFLYSRHFCIRLRAGDVANGFLRKVVQRRGIPWRSRPMEWLFLYSRRQFCIRVDIVFVLLGLVCIRVDFVFILLRLEMSRLSHSVWSFLFGLEV